MSTRIATLLVVTAVAVAAAIGGATAQPATKTYRIGMMWSSDSADPSTAPRLAAFRRGLEADGYAEGRYVTLEHRYAGGKLDQFPMLAAELVASKVDVIIASSPLAIRAARQATATIPIVMINGDAAMFASFARPGGNLTGLTALQEELAAKQVELIKEAVPGLTRLAVLRNPTQPVHALKLRAAEEVARALRLPLYVADARVSGDFEGAFAAMARERVGGLVVFADGTFATNRARIAQLAMQQSLPTCFGSSLGAEAGGLIAYVPSADEAYRRAASYVTRILKGAHPADLPVEQPTRFELSVNLKTARALRLTLPQSLLVRADHVIQ